ncbi:hypothetical protein [Lentilactobacillus rapi]|uniref:hypothetical protein n=1 Tax=Lentilactobacillus rapi TaxID=481723 RepID=UPI0006D15FFE|nr:hypothetical protein [Lentilactobacillus rapi]
MKKTLLALATVALALPLFGSTTKAASWHRGTPTALRGYWKSYNRSLHHTFTYKITKTSAYATGFDPDYIKNTRYKYLGHHYYVINGYEPLYSKKNGPTATLNGSIVIIWRTLGSKVNTIAIGAIIINEG